MKAALLQKLTNKEMVGKRLAEIREARGIGQTDLIKRTGCTGLAKNEAGFQMPSWETLAKLATFYGMRMQDLVGEILADVEEPETVTVDEIPVLPAYHHLYELIARLLNSHDRARIEAMVLHIEDAVLALDNHKPLKFPPKKEAKRSSG